jgi:1,4-dihydroxy-2-naphthoate octaprenyltransferase
MPDTLESRATAVMPSSTADPAPPARLGTLHAWRVAIRPRTLLVAVSPVIVGAALAFERAGTLDLAAVVLVMGAAVLVQIATNLQNDVGYTMRGGDRGGTRTGLPRATASGWLSVSQVRIGLVIVSIAALVLGLLLVVYRGWPVLVIGAASLAAALAYMGGPKPIAYTPLGELTVFVFFGLIAVTGTEWVLSGGFGTLGLLAGIAIGGLAAAALAVNNHRDVEHDRSVGRRTFAVLAGAGRSGQLYAALLLGPFVLMPVMASYARAPSLLLPLALAPLAWRLRQDFARCKPGVDFNQILFRTFRLELCFALMLAAGLLGIGVPH